MAFDDTLNKILEENRKNNINISNIPIATNKSDTNPYSNENDIPTLLGAFGLGGANMLNNTIFGGLGQVLGSLGAGVEAISPFSGGNDDKVLNLIKLGVPLQEAEQIYPHEDSWLTSLAKGSLGVHNAIDDQLDEWRDNLLGDNPTLAAQIAEGTGSSIGFMGAGLATSALGATPGIGALLGALASGSMEALSESGGTLADAYRAGRYDDGGLSAANKSFATNALLNSVLNATVGRFNPKIATIRNPLTRFLAGTGAEVANELLQEPSQQVIEKAANQSLNNGGNFMSALSDESANWWDTAKQLAPSVAGSTLLTQALIGAGGMATQQGRQNFANDWEMSRVKTHSNEQTDNTSLDNLLAPPPENHDRLFASLQNEHELKEKLLADLQNAEQQNQEQKKIDLIRERIQKADNRIQSLNDLLLPETYTAPSTESIQNLTPLATQNTEFPEKNDNSQTAQDFPRKQRLSRKNNTPENIFPIGTENTPTQTIIQPLNTETNNSTEQKSHHIEPVTVNNSQEFTEEQAIKVKAPVLNSNIQQDIDAQAALEAEKQKKEKDDLFASRPVGKTVKVVTAPNHEVDVRYRVTDADSLITSTNDTGAPNADYPQELQPRQRNREASHEQIIKMSGNLDPELLAESRLASNGAPIIGNNGIVESGNARIMAIRRAYRYGTGENYRNWLINNSGRFGINPDTISKIRNPVLVRERITDVDRVKFTREANESSTSQMSMTEHAINDAQSITPEMLTLFDPEKTLQANHDFISAFSSIVPQSEHGDFYQQNGKISKSGLERIQNALMAKAYNDTGILNRLNEIFDDDIKNVSNALLQAAPKLAVFENGGYSPEISIRDDIVQAVHTLAQLRQEGSSVEDFMSQIQMFGDISDEAKTLLQFFDRNKRSAKRIAKGLIYYADSAMNHAKVGQGVLFEDNNSTKEDMLNEAIRRTTGETGNDNSQNQDTSFNQPPINNDVDFDSNVQTDKQNNQTENNITNYDGFIGSLDIDHNGQTFPANLFADEHNGTPYLDITDNDGNSVAVYDMKNDAFHVRDESKSTGWVKRIEDDFRREFGKNPSEEILRRTFRQKAIDAGQDFSLADNLSKVFIAGQKYFAHYSGQSLYDTVNADKISIVKDENTQGKKDRGSTQFLEAQTIVRLFQNSDKSTLLHELGHIFLNKLQKLHAAGKLDGRAKLDWGNIIREYGLQKIDFSKDLSQNDKAKLHNAHEKFAASFEKYFFYGQSPNSKLQHVFKSFKNWLKDIYGSIRNIRYSDAKGKTQKVSMSDDIKQVFDHLLADYQPQTLDNSRNALNSSDTTIEDNNNAKTEIIQDNGYNSDNPEREVPNAPEIKRQNKTEIQGNTTANSKNYHNQPKQGFFDWVKNIGKKVLSPVFSIAHVAHKPSITDFQDLRFENEISEQGYTNNEKGIQRLGLIGRIKNTAREITHSLKGDFPELSASPRAKELNLYNALNMFRDLNRRKKYAVSSAMATFAHNLKGLNPNQRDLFARYRLLDDLNWRKNNNPEAELPFGFDEDSLRREHKRFTSMVTQDKKVWDAVQAEERTMQKINSDFVKYSSLLGINLDGVFKNPHYYRHIVLDYANTAAYGRFRHSAKGNIDVQGMADSELRAILGRGYMKKYKGSSRDISTNYVQANAEVRAQMLQDIETLKTLLELKKAFDIAPKLMKKVNYSPEVTSQVQHSETYSQSNNDSGETLSDHIPDGYEVFDPAATRLVESAHSSAENLFSMSADDISMQTGIPLDKILHYWGIDEEASNRLCVFPSEIVDALRRLSQKRHRGMLGQAAKTLTTWWKKAVLFSPTRNLKYNFRNFTGDLDALIAGNPQALKQLPRSVKDLTAYFLHEKEKDFTANKDLQDYIERSAGLGIESLNLSSSDAQKLLKMFNDTQKNGKSFDFDKINLVKKFFKAETGFTEWREHLLRYAAYLDYKQQMESNENGKPNNWGASIEDEVMALDNIKDRAFKMSNELLGAYDQVSEVGKQLRDMLVPFYSWMEVNLRRYYRLFKNAAKGGNTKNLLGQIMLGKTAAIPAYALSTASAFGRIALFTLATQMFNRFVWPDADDDLPDDIKYRPHITLGKSGNDVYYFDRIGALADVADWLSLDSLFLDAKDIANGQQTLGGYVKKMLQAPFNKALNGLNPMIKMPIELAMGRSMFPDVFHPSTIRDPYKYIASSFGLTWPYKAITGEPHNNIQELTNLGIYSLNADEAAYWQTLDKVRQFQNNVLDKHFDGFASTARGRILQKLKLALRYNDKKAIRRYLREYSQADGTKQGLKASMKAMHPLHSLSEKEKAQFKKWITANDRKYLRKAERYFHHLADRYM